MEVLVLLTDPRIHVHAQLDTPELIVKSHHAQLLPASMVARVLLMVQPSSVAVPMGTLALTAK